jgi:catechol 2,3-dioxygenase-like lactoylglutathione lyase family enzyme
MTGTARILTGMRVSRIIIHAHDLPRMAAFYVDILGLRIIADQRADGWMTFDGGAVEIALHGMPALRTIDWMPKIVFTVPSIEDAWRHFRDHGVLVGRIEAWNGSRMFDFTDHEGNDYQCLAPERSS